MPAAIDVITSLGLIKQKPFSKKCYKLLMYENALMMANTLPLMVAKGSEGPVVGITASLHGNELNGIEVIHRLWQDLDISKLKGTIVFCPVLNGPGFLQEKREFHDGSDLNRLFPGKEDGNRSNRYAYKLFNELIQFFNIHIDLHTASSGRENSYYIKTDLSDPFLKNLALLANPQIVVNEKGPQGTLRALCEANNIKALTIEIGNPHCLQKAYIQNAYLGLKQVLAFLSFSLNKTTIDNKTIICQRSFWIYSDNSGLLTIDCNLGDKLDKDQPFGVIKNIYGETVTELKAPQASIVIGKASEPVCEPGARLLHLGLEG